MSKLTKAQRAAWLKTSRQKVSVILERYRTEHAERQYFEGSEPMYDKYFFEGLEILNREELEGGE